ncbi:hypothetical protein [Mycoplasmopsis cricetuli]|uniref:hypothetical protein n=1 Tax=Mycoplasmopsis cricetuli TaxID=171283 RepID=UPI00046E8A24|nr:hypothetical protein [Mycoplasmopsis cricetuli]
MIYSIEEIKNNKDFILSQTLDVVSIYDSFRKILLKVATNDQALFHYLTFSYFTDNSTFTRDIKLFAGALGYLIVLKRSSLDKKTQLLFEQLENNKIKCFDDLIKNQVLFHQFYNLAKETFFFLQLDGSANDIIKLVNDLNIFTLDQQQKLLSTTLILRPVNGCDLPN